MSRSNKLEEIYHLTTARDHMLFKEMWGGSAKVMTQKIYTMSKVPRVKDGVLDGYNWKVTLEDVDVSDRFVKCVDEIIANLSDHYQRTKTFKGCHKITMAFISFDLETGNILVSNNGDGFDVAIHKEDPQKRYIPEIILTEALRGSNYQKNKKDRKAGTNGVGTKLTNAHSLSFSIDTFDSYNNVRYQQTYLNHISIINPPIISKGTSETPPITKIEFQLDYAAVGYGYLDPLDPDDKKPNKPESNKRKCTITKEQLMQLEKVVRMRVCQMATFLGKNVTIYYNGDEVPFKTLESLASAMYEGKKLFIGKGLFYDAPAKTVADADKNNAKKIEEINSFNKNRELIDEWQIIVAVDLNKYEHSSIVNGVICVDGNHLEKIKEDLHTAAKERAAELITDSSKYHGQLISMVAIMMSGDIPDVEWGGGQIKNSVKMDKKTFAGLELEKKFVKEICEALYDRMLIIKGTTKKTANVRVRNERYERAEQLGAGAVLILTEGQSADTMVQTGRRDPKCGLGTKKYGTFFLGGVPMNARKEVEIRTVEGYEPIKVQSKRLANNQSFQEFVTITGLDFNKKYDTPKEIETLKYQEFWLVVDEDLDGRGAICGLFLNFIELFWPNLFKHKMIKRLRTPVVRLYPKSKKNTKVLEFFDEVKAKEFLKKDNNSDLYKIEYYKGLAGHNPFETINIFKTYKNNLITYTLDDNGKAIFDMYYADLTAPRKLEFSSPVRDLTNDEKTDLELNKIIKCSTQLQVYTKEYKLDNLIRKLPSIVDGFVVTRRRILYSALIHFGSKPEVLKVFQFGGVAAQNGYHHGNDSLYDIIIKMAQYYDGGPILPILEGHGQLGSSRKGGQDAGGARYVGVCLNKNLTSKLFPSSDTSILYYLTEDGKRSIPLYYVPVVPMVLFRSEKIPADGWSYITWARDVPATLGVLRKMIKGDLNAALTNNLPPSPVGFKGQFMYKDGDEYSLGTYTATDKEIVITSLPLRIWSKSYINNFCKIEEYKDANRPNVIKKRFIEDEYADEFKEYFAGSGPADKCSNNDVRIVFTLKPGALEKIKLTKDNTVILNKIQNMANSDEKVIKPPIDDNEDDDDIKPVEALPSENIKVGDAIQKFFGLVVKMRHNLNIITKEGAVKEYSNYGSILYDWFPIRKEMYEKRIYREMTLLKIEADYLKEQLRFCRDYDKIGMNVKLTGDQMNGILEKNKFLRVYKRMYDDPGYLDENPTEKLYSLTFDSKDANYIYLLYLHSLDRSLESQKKLEEKIINIEKQLNAMLDEWNKDPFHGASQWLRELADFEKVYTEGIKTSWRFGKDDNITFETSG